MITVGTQEASDALIELNLTQNEEIEIILESKTASLFGKQIKNTVSQTLKEYAIKGAQVTIKDNGALDFIITARLITAIRRSQKGETL